MAIIKSKTITLKNGKEVCFRTTTEDDIPKVLEYWEAIFQDDRFFHNTTEEIKEWLTPEKEREHIERHNNNPNNLLLMAEANGQFISMCAFESEDKLRTRHTGEVGISVLPEYRKMSLGTAMMQGILDWATTHPDIEKLSLEVWAKNTPAIGLYQKMGFIEEGRKVKEIKYADGTYDDCVCMYRFVKNIFNLK